MSRWFRMYDSVVDDPKVQRLSGSAFKLWVNLLCIASQNDGALPSAADVSFKLRISRRKVEVALSELQSANLIDEKDGVLSPHNWAARQYESDVSTQRVKRHRERKRNVSCNVSGNANETPCNGDETVGETAPEQNRTESPHNPPKTAGPRRPPDWPDDYRERFWAAYPNKVGKPKALAKLDGIAKRGTTRWSEIMDGLQRYIRDKPPDRPWCNPETWINQERWADAPANVLPLSLRPNPAPIRFPDGIV